MGYTHYWWKPKELDPNKFKIWTEDIRAIIQLASKSGIIIKGTNGAGEPVITDNMVAFNGDASTNDACEPFIVERVEKKDIIYDSYFKSCKTEIMPYDVVVVTSLISLKYRFSEIKIKSPDLKIEDEKVALMIIGQVLKISKEELINFLSEKK